MNNDEESYTCSVYDIDLTDEYSAVDKVEYYVWQMGSSALNLLRWVKNKQLLNTTLKFVQHERKGGAYV